jgi:hypothetical protein
VACSVFYVSVCSAASLLTQLTAHVRSKATQRSRTFQPRFPTPASDSNSLSCRYTSLSPGCTCAGAGLTTPSQLPSYLVIQATRNMCASKTKANANNLTSLRRTSMNPESSRAWRSCVLSTSLTERDEATSIPSRAKSARASLFCRDCTAVRLGREADAGSDACGRWNRAVDGMEVRLG